jgi:hypothetical protein
MNVLTRLPAWLKGIILMAAGVLLFIDTIGLRNELIHIIVIASAIALILWGAYLARLYSLAYRLFRKKPAPLQPIFTERRFDEPSL